MVSVDKAIVVKYSKGGHRFEILADPDLAWAMKRGEDVDLDDMLASFEVYRDARKGERAPESEVQNVFGTTDIYEVAKRIVREGEVHLTTEQRRKMYEDLRQKIANMIARRTIDPRTGAPHTLQRVLAAMDQAKVHLDIFKRPEDQVQAVIDALRKIIPIRVETKKLELVIPSHYASKLYSHLRRYKVLREHWGDDGSLVVVLDVPAGMLEEVLRDFSSATHGDVQSRILE